MAYDVRRHRVWAICNHCERWTLLLPEDRPPALHHLQRIARDEAHVVGSTANVTLLETSDRSLLRIGAATLPEQAWWRYGRELRRRRAAVRGPGATVSTFTYGALAQIGEASGLLDIGLRLGWADDARTGILRWRHFPLYAWRGRVPCVHCGSVLCALRFDLSWWLYPRNERGGVSVGVPCPRCDPWSREKVFSIRGDDAALVLRRVLAWQHVEGASDERIARATRGIEDAGSAEAFIARVADGRRTLSALGPTLTVALEIAVNHQAERQTAGAQLRALEAAWQREEEVAAIVDDVLTPVARSSS